MSNSPVTKGWKMPDKLLRQVPQAAHLQWMPLLVEDQRLPSTRAIKSRYKA